MAKILIVYASSEGQTAKIAHEMAGALRADGHTVQATRVEDAPGEIPSDCDLILAGSPVHLGKHDAVMVAWVKVQLDRLEQMHGAFFSVSLAAASADPDERAAARKLVDEFEAETGWRPELVAQFAGALTYSRYGLIKRLLMQRIARQHQAPTDPSHDYELTDWDSVIAFARDAAKLAEAPPD